MAVPTSEYRERLLAQGCDEDIADVFSALVDSVCDDAECSDAEAEVLMKVGEQVARSEQLLIQQLTDQIERSEQQYRTIDFALGEITRVVEEQAEQGAAGSRLEVARIALALAQARSRNVQRSGAESKQLYSEVMIAHKRLRAGQQVLRAEQKVEHEQRMAALAE